MLKYCSENSPPNHWLALSFGFQKIRNYYTTSAILIREAYAKTTSLEWPKGETEDTPITSVSVLACAPGSFLKPEVFCVESPVTGLWPRFALESQV